MVRAAKTAPNAVLENHRLTDEILLTSLTLVENILNSCKLTPMSENPGDLKYLTPNHLLLSRVYPNLSSAVFTEKPLSAKQKWRIAEQKGIAEQYWCQWMEVIPNPTEENSNRCSQTLKLVTSCHYWLNQPSGFLPSRQWKWELCFTTVAKVSLYSLFHDFGFSIFDY